MNMTAIRLNSAGTHSRFPCNPSPCASRTEGRTDAHSCCLGWLLVAGVRPHGVGSIRPCRTPQDSLMDVSNSRVSGCRNLVVIRQRDQGRAVTACAPPVNESAGILQRLELLRVTCTKAIGGSNLYCQRLVWTNVHGRHLARRHRTSRAGCVRARPLKPRNSCFS